MDARAVSCETLFSGRSWNGDKKKKSRVVARVDLRFSKIGVAAPEEDGQHDHEEGVGTQIGRESKIGVQSGGAQGILHVGQVGGLPTHDGDQKAAQAVAPDGQLALVWLESAGGQFQGSNCGQGGAQWTRARLPAS